MINMMVVFKTTFLFENYTSKVGGKPIPPQQKSNLDQNHLRPTRSSIISISHAPRFESHLPANENPALIRNYL